MCTGCEKVSEELLDVIQDLRSSGPHSRWKSFRQALMSVWKEHEIDTLSQRLERYRRQIDTILLVSMREEFLREQAVKEKSFQEHPPSKSNLRGNPLEVDSSNDNMHRRKTQGIKRFVAYTQAKGPEEDEANVELNLGTLGRTIAEMKQIHRELMDILEQNNGRLRSQNEKELFHSAVAGGAKIARENRAKSRILEKLRFTNMRSRFAHIPKAYQKTFDWIFRETNGREVFTPDGSGRETSISLGQQTPTMSNRNLSQNRRPWSSLVKWLHGDENLYWITGKPGSGKSTLMKYLSLDHRTKQHLEIWGEGTPIVTTRELERWGWKIPFPIAEDLESWGGAIHIVTAEDLEEWRGKTNIVAELKQSGGKMHIVVPEHLEKWGRKIPVVTAGFFFWNSGTTMQMSEMGLLQTLLYRAIEDHKELIPQLFPDRWKYYELFSDDFHPWSLSELYQAFEVLISDKSKRFFFFIDGIDEFEGDEGKMARFILNIASSKENVKMCVSSRPWLAFEDAFQHRPSLRLEDLTAPDIQLFVSGNLNGNNIFSRLQRIQPVDANGLILEVTEKACGVFLWVQLVVLSLLEGLQDGDNISDLKGRLLLLPSDLEELFAKIIGRLNPKYLQQASMIFQLIKAAGEPLSLLSLSFAHETIGTAKAAEIKVMGPDEMQLRAELMRRRLNSRCRGLIEAPDFEEKGYNAKAQYLHRTVRDFLGSAWQDWISSKYDSFDPDLALCGAFLLHLKAMNQEKRMFLEEFWNTFETCVAYSSRFKDRAPQLHADVMRALDQTGDGLFQSAHPNGEPWLKVIVADIKAQGLLSMQLIRHWYQIWSIEFEGYGFLTFSRPTFEDFSRYAFEYQLPSYMKYKLEADEISNLGDTGPYLLSNAISRQDVEMVNILLQRGVSPNCKVGNRTAWHNLLKTAKIPAEVHVKEKQANIVEKFLGYGADPRIVVQDQSAEASIRMAFQDWSQRRTDELLRILAKSPKRQKKFKWSSPGFKVLFRRSAQSEATSSNADVVARS
jgi:hypothetical protein